MLIGKFGRVLLALTVVSVTACVHDKEETDSKGPGSDDTTAPTVASTSPASGATGVALGADVTATFSEAVDEVLFLDASSITLSTTSGGAAVAGTVTLSGNTATFNPGTDLQANTQYTATIDAVAVEDAAGNEMAADYVWTFTTVAVGGGGGDTTAPTVLSTSPANGATGVAVGSNITATFSESMASGTITTSIFTLSPTSGGSAVAGTVSLSGTTATFNPNADLAASTQYTATITTAATDAAGNPLAANKVWSFTTASASVVYVDQGTDVSPVNITGMLPYNGTVGTGESYYKITGLTPSTPYTLRLSNETDVDVYFESYRNAALNEFGCDGGSCATQSSSSGELYVVVYGWDTAAGATFTLNASLSVSTNVTPGNMPISGTVNASNAIYTVAGLNTAKSYEVTYSTMAAMLLNVSLGNFVSEECWLRTTFFNTCIVSSVTELGLFVDGTSTTSSTAFTINVQEVTVTSVAATSLPYSGTVGAGHGFYTLTGLTPNAIYTVTLSGLTDNADLYLHFFGDGFSYPECSSLLSDTASETCAVKADSQGRLNVTVDGSNTTSGTSFTLNATAGVATTSLAKTSLPYTGTMSSGYQRFVITGLTANMTYTVSLTGLSGDIDVEVYSDAGFSNSLCFSDNIGTANDACSALSNASGQLFIELLQYDAGTLNFTLNVTP